MKFTLKASPFCLSKHCTKNRQDMLMVKRGTCMLTISCKSRIILRKYKFTQEGHQNQRKFLKMQYWKEEPYESWFYEVPKVLTSWFSSFPCSAWQLQFDYRIEGNSQDMEGTRVVPQVKALKKPHSPGNRHWSPQQCQKKRDQIVLVLLQNQDLVQF